MTLTRRQLLRGLGGAVLALPWLRSRARGAGEPPKRFVFFFHPNGVLSSSFMPTRTSDTSFTLGQSQGALEPFRPDLLWISGLDLSVALSGIGEQHQRGLGGLLTGTKLDSGSFIGNDGSTAGWALGASLDQLLAQALGHASPVASLQLGVNVRERDVSGVLSYAGPARPLLPQNDPRQTYRTLFFTQGAARELSDTTLLRRRSVLDAVSVQLRAMRGAVSREDQQRLDEHAALVRDLELRLAALPATGDPLTTPPGGQLSYEGCAASGEPAITDPETVEAMPEAARLQIELLALALRCDLTRVATFCVSDAKNHISLPFLDIAGDVHNISHLSDSDPNREKLGVRDAWMSELFALLLGKLKSAAELDGSSVLDHSLLLWGSEVSRGNIHSHLDMPFVAAGHALGWRMNRALSFASRPHNDLLLSIARGFGLAGEVFGDPAFCTGELTNLV